MECEEIRVEEHDQNADRNEDPKEDFPHCYCCRVAERKVELVFKIERRRLR